jgi:hypothetical protein
MTRLHAWDQALCRHGLLAVAALLLLLAGAILYASQDVRGVRASQVKECQAELPNAWCSFDLGKTLGPIVAGYTVGLAAVALLAWGADLALQRRAPRADVALRVVLALLVLGLGVALLYDTFARGSYTCVGDACYVFRPAPEDAFLSAALGLAFVAAAANLSRRPTAVPSAPPT